MTFMHLFAEYRLTSDKEIPAEIEQAISSSKIFSSSANDEEKYPATVAEMDRTLAALDRASSLFRTYFAPGIFQSRTYLDNIAKERKRAKEYSHNVPRVECGNQKHGIKAHTPVYIVRRELFDYYFIEEKGAFKLFYVDLFPNFKLTF